MIDLGIAELDAAILDGLDKVLAGAGGPGWSVDDQGRCTLDTQLWKRLTDLTVSEPGGGDEMAPTFLTAALVAEKLGEALVGLPLIDHLVALRVLDAVGYETARAQAGPIALVLPAEQVGGVQPPLSLGGAVAGRILWLKPDGAIELLKPDAAAYVPNLGDLPVGRVDGSGEPLAAGRTDLLLQATLERKVLFSAALAGMSRKAVALAVEYANQRELFGAPIGAFQSLAHSLSTAKVHADGAELLAREAAWALEGEPEAFERRARMAYAFASAAGDLATRTAVHVFGGYGVTRDYPAQAYFRAARSLSLLAGDRRLDLRAVGRDLARSAAAAGPVFSSAGDR